MLINLEKILLGLGAIAVILLGVLITTNVVAQGNVKMEYRTRHLDWCGKSMVWHCVTIIKQLQTELMQD